MYIRQEFLSHPGDPSSMAPFKLSATFTCPAAAPPCAAQLVEQAQKGNPGSTASDSSAKPGRTTTSYSDSQQPGLSRLAGCVAVIFAMAAAFLLQR